MNLYKEQIIMKRKLQKISEDLFNKYRQVIFPKIKFLRGTTRLKDGLYELSIRLKTSKSDKLLYTDLDDIKWIDYHDLKPEIYEKDYSSQIIKETIKSKTFCDVGSYHGYYSLKSRAKKSYCFEADPTNFKWLRANLILNNSNCVAENKAIWKETGKIKLDNSSDTKSSISSKGLEIESITLDDFFRDKDNPEVIKIDVEGAEKEVLEGAQRILENEKPTLFIEVHLDRGVSYDSIEKFLINFDYNITYRKERGSEVLIKAK